MQAAALTAVVSVAPAAARERGTVQLINDLIEAAIEPWSPRPRRLRGDPESRNLALRPLGMGGVESRKVSNLYVNLGRGLAKTATSVVTLGGISTLQPWLVPFAFLAVLADLWNASAVRLSERHAVVVWGLYDRGVMSPERALTADELRPMVNRHLGAHDRGPMSLDELVALLGELKNLRCVGELAHGQKPCGG